jgi:hypothetical protein
MAVRKLFLQSSMLRGFLLAKQSTSHYLFTIMHSSTPFLKGSRKSSYCSSTPTLERYFRTAICISRVTQGGVLLAYIFFADSAEERILLFESELLLKDRFFEGVSKFLNLQRYISL